MNVEYLHISNKYYDFLLERNTNLDTFKVIIGKHKGYNIWKKGCYFMIISRTFREFIKNMNNFDIVFCCQNKEELIKKYFAELLSAEDRMR